MTQNQNQSQNQTLQNREISLEQAIETLDRFIGQHEQEEVILPTLQPFQMKDGSLEVRPLSALETTLSCLMEAASKEKRLEKQRLKKPIQASLLQSIDAIQIALVKLASKECDNPELAERLKVLASRYNTIVKRAKKVPETFSQRVTYFFYKAAGWLINDELLENPIQLPDILSSKKFTHTTPHPTSLKIASFIDATHPFTQELDLFCAKAQTLLKHENLPQPVLTEALKALRGSSIEATLSSDEIVSMRLPLSLLPGEELIVTGDFSRKQAISVPIKESFKIIAKATQTGFPHPLQHAGFGFSDAFLPTLLLRPYLAPKLDLLLKKKHEIAYALMPRGHLNEKAKALLQLRKQVFQKNKIALLHVQKKCVEAFFEAAKPANGKLPTAVINAYFQDLEQRENPFVDESLFHADLIMNYVEKPIQAVKEEWLSGMVKTASDVEAILERELEKEKPTGSHAEYVELFRLAITKAVIPLSCLVLSEKIGFKPELLDLFSKKILDATITELTDFHTELETVDLHEETVLSWLFSIIQKKTAIFSAKICTDHMTDKVEAYFILRALG